MVPPLSSPPTQVLSTFVYTPSHRSLRKACSSAGCGRGTPSSLPALRLTFSSVFTVHLKMHFPILKFKKAQLCNHLFSRLFPSFRKCCLSSSPMPVLGSEDSGINQSGQTRVLQGLTLQHSQAAWRSREGPHPRLPGKQHNLVENDRVCFIDCTEDLPGALTT